MASSSCAHPRIHVAPEPLEPGEAGLFIAASLLLSHGVRPCTLALVRLRGAWIAAPSWSIRQFRPDEDSRAGWVKAVLRGKKLGAHVAPPAASPEEVLEAIGVKPAAATRCVAARPPTRPEALEAAARALLEGLPLAYTARGCSREPTLGAPPTIAPAIVNIAVDRLQAGLPLPRPQGTGGPHRGLRGG